MRFVYVLEDDLKFQKEICEAISFLDPKIQIRIFPKLENFGEWLRLMMTTGPAAISMGGQIPTTVPQDPVPEGEIHQLVLVVSKIEFLGAKQLGLLRRARDLFVQRKICTREDPTAFVLTAFEDPEFKIRDLEDRILNNVLFKPFDRLILIQDLTFAIDGRHPPSKYTIANQKTTAIVEMLKDVELEAFSEIGIVTKSYREIAVGAVAKYYGTPFVTPRHRSVIAICRECVVHPEDPKAFRCSFTFLAADPTQISSFRKIAKNKKATEYIYDWKSLRRNDTPDRVHAVMLDEEEEGPSGLQGILTKRFESFKITVYESYVALHADLDPAEAVKNRDANLKAFGNASSVTLHFDLAGLTYLGFESDQKDLMSLFGSTEAELKKTQNWFSKALIPEHKEKYKHYAKTATLEEDNVLVISSHNVQFYLKVVEVKKEDKKFNMKLSELSKDEQIEWLTKNSRIKDPVDLLIISHRFFNDGAEERWTRVVETLKQRFGKAPLIFMTAKKDFSDQEERVLGKYVADIFFKPIDRTYFEQKMKWAFPRLVDKGDDKIHFDTIAYKEVIKTANPVTVSEISEAGFTMQYYRTIAVGSFREIVLWQPYEIGAPELLATCNFVEEGEKSVFTCHFVFFGITDHFLKHIRVWIRDNYIHSKEGGGGG